MSKVARCAAAHYVRKWDHEGLVQVRLAIVCLLSFALAQCAARPAPAPLTPSPQGRIGAADIFGPGIVVASSRILRFVLARPASVIVLQVFPDGIDVITPRHSHDRSEFPAGDHRIDARVFTPPLSDQPSYAESTPSESRCLANYANAVAQQPRDSLGRPIPNPASHTAAQELVQCQERSRASPRSVPGPIPTSLPARGYWMVIVADAPTSARELQQRLRPMDITQGGFATVLRELPGVLVGGRTERWAAYYAPIGH
jgi:hypothetical protein